MIEEICEKLNIKNYTINPDGSIDVNGNVLLTRYDLTELPLKFNKVSGSFTCSYNKLTSLFGCPNYVGGDFSCGDNKLTNLGGIPRLVGSDIYCRNNNITDLTGLNKFNGELYCTGNPIGSIIRGPVEQDFIYAFQVYQVINGLEVNLKRLKYVMSTWDRSIDLEEIEKHYKLV